MPISAWQVDQLYVQSDLWMPGDELFPELIQWATADVDRRNDGQAATQAVDGIVQISNPGIQLFNKARTLLKVGFPHVGQRQAFVGSVKQLRPQLALQLADAS